MNDDILFTLAKFPGNKDRILDEYFKNEDFRTLVEDFFSAAKTLDYYKSRLPRYTKSEMEYQSVFQELEKEIIQFLNKNRKSHV